MPSTPFINTASYVAKIFLLLSSVNFGSTCFDMSSTVVLDRSRSVRFVCLTVQHTRGYQNPIRTHGLRTKVRTLRLINEAPGCQGGEQPYLLNVTNVFSLKTTKTRLVVLSQLVRRCVENRVPCAFVALFSEAA